MHFTLSQINKNDIAQNKTNLSGISISAKNKQNIDKIKDEILNMAMTNKIGRIAIRFMFLFLF